MKTIAHRLPLVILPCLAMTLSVPAHAYVGPGAGLGVIGTLVGIVAAIVLAMFGLLWYPLKRAFGKKTAAEGVPPLADGSGSADPTAARAGAETTAGHRDGTDTHRDATR